MKSYIIFINYIQRRYADFIFSAIFFSLLLVVKYASTFNPLLTSFPNRMIGIATLEGYDINKRISVFYIAGLLFFLGITSFSVIAWKIATFSEHLFKSIEFKIINYTSIAGIILLFFSLWANTIESSLSLIYGIQITICLGFLIKKIFFFASSTASKSIAASIYSFTFIIGIGVFFILNEISALFKLDYIYHFLTTVSFCVIILIICLSFFIIRKTYLEAESILKKIVYVFVPFALIPLFSVLKDEIYLIFNRHEIYFFSPKKLYLIGLFLIVASLFWRYKKIKKNTNPKFSKSAQQLIATRYLPILIIGIAAFTFYSPFIQASTEMFEAGNRFLPIMEFRKFGVIPIIEKFNSHLLSELFFAGIYTSFNGMNAREPLIYDFGFQIIWTILVYYFIYKLSRSPYIALFLILLFPLTNYLFDDYIIIALVAIFVLNKVISERASLTNYLLLFVCITLLLIWRIDIGYPAVISISFTLFIYWINEKRFTLSSKILLKAISIFSALTLLLLLIISWWRNINVFKKIWSALNYLSSAQAYGIVNYGDTTFDEFKMHYFVFPLIIIVGILSMLVMFKSLNTSKGQRFVYMSFLFLTIYYLINFQRGLVRHSFYEGYDNMLSAFLFFLLSGSVYLFLYKKSQVFKFILFMMIATFLLMNYKFPKIVAIENVYSKAIKKAESISALETLPITTRCIDGSLFENSKFGNFKKIVADELSEKQTFIDFSNTPMLYYITQKISPSYFYQNPLTIHNDYLQEQFIKDLKKYDAPLIVFSHYPENYWDRADGVPNSVRHYRMAEYIFMNYKPFAIIDSLCIWKRKDFEIKNREKIVYQYHKNNTDTTENPPYLSKLINNEINKKYLFTIAYNSSLEKSPSVFITDEKDLVLEALKTFNKTNNGLVGSYVYTSSKENFIFKIENNKIISSLIITECDYIPDFYSVQPQQFNLQQLPYIWGTYDKEVNKEKILMDLSPQVIDFKTNTPLVFHFSNLIDKSTGNTLFISLNGNNKNDIPIKLTFGDENVNDRGNFNFIIPKGEGERKLAIRVSTQYNWYLNTINNISLHVGDSDKILVKKIQLLKGS